MWLGLPITAAVIAETHNPLSSPALEFVIKATLFLQFLRIPAVIAGYFW
jgi:hypothetical protein